MNLNNDKIVALVFVIITLVPIYFGTPKYLVL